MKLHILILFFLSLFLCRVNGQNLFLPDTTISVTVNGNMLENGFAGGLNFPTFSSIDLNGDGIKDLFAFDRSGSTTTRISTYINVGTPNAVSYKYAPYYRKFFPEMKNWALLVDYNCDGKEDIFTSTPGGMMVYRNDYTATNGLKFVKMTELLHSVYFSPPPVNLWVSPVNLPGFADIDGDGDMDILTFGLLGFQLEYHINKSMETYGHCDSLTFQLGSACWGQFSLDPFTNKAILGQSCPFKPGVIPTEDIAKNNLHNGSAMIILDLNDDNLQDMIMGDILGNNLLALFNGGTQAVAEMTSQDTLYPPGNPFNIPTYAVPMYIDVNNDGVNDLVVAPTYLNNYNGIWLYKNNGTNTQPVFNFVKNAFMQDQMIDMGEGAYPVFFDYDGDGLMDIVAGNYGYFDPSATYPSSLHLYRNTGTLTDPSFELITIDLANTLSLGLNGVHPTFGDLDGDGDMDMILGDSEGKLHYFTNTAGPGNVANFVLTIPNLNNFDVGLYSAPQLIDLNKNGLLDLVVGRRDGRLSYFENIGTPSNPSFIKVTDSLGFVDVKTQFSVTGHSVPFIYEYNGEYRLLVGTETGTIYMYDNIEGNLNGTFDLKDVFYHSINEGSRVSPHGADINGDGKMDLILGNYAGGLTIYLQSNIPVAVNEIKDETLEVSFYPNPAHSNVTIAFPTPLTSETEIQFFNTLGQIIKTTKTHSQVVNINVSLIPAGFYFLKVRVDNKQVIQKLLISR